MEPKLATTYSSQAPNGLLGVGFSLSGLSAISRSGPTQWHDDKRGGVSLSENPATNESADRFARASVPGGDAMLSFVETENPAWHPRLIG